MPLRSCWRRHWSQRSLPLMHCSPQRSCWRQRWSRRSLPQRRWPQQRTRCRPRSFPTWRQRKRCSRPQFCWRQHLFQKSLRPPHWQLTLRHRPRSAPPVQQPVPHLQPPPAVPAAPAVHSVRRRPVHLLRAMHPQRSVRRHFRRCPEAPAFVPAYSQIHFSAARQYPLRWRQAASRWTAV